MLLHKLEMLASWADTAPVWELLYWGVMIQVDIYVLFCLARFVASRVLSMVTK